LIIAPSKKVVNLLPFVSDQVILPSISRDLLVLHVEMQARVFDDDAKSIPIADTSLLLYLVAFCLVFQLSCRNWHPLGLTITDRPFHAGIQPSDLGSTLTPK